MELASCIILHQVLYDKGALLYRRTVLLYGTRAMGAACMILRGGSVNIASR
jgi:hypothetical protein